MLKMNQFLVFKSISINRSMENIPWIEKYRPSNFGDIVLEDINKKILNNIIETNHVPNLLFYVRLFS